MKPPFPLSLPAAGSPARLPALLVPVLAGLAVVQLLLPQTPPQPMTAGRVARVPVPPVPAPPSLVFAPVALNAHPLFAASGHSSPGAGGSATPAPTDPLGGVRIAGSVRQGAALRAVIVRPNGTVAYLALGGRVGPWRLAALASDQARLVGPGGATLSVPFGAQARLRGPTPSEDEQ